MIHPMLPEMVSILADAMAELREHISEVHYGKIDGSTPYVKFKFRGEDKELPIPANWQEVVLGWDGLADKKVALASMLNAGVKLNPN